MRLARLRRATARLCALLEEAGGELTLIREEALTALDGKLRGTPDLIVRAARAHWLIDYKTGPVLRQDGDGARDSYVRQLQLYAVLEHEASGTWPQRAILLPLGGPAVDVDVHPDSCEDVARQSMALLESYDEAVPTHQPASPSPEVCGSCPYATHCTALWQALDETWAGLVAVTGTVAEAVPTQLGGVSFAVDVRAGTVATERLSVRNVLVSEHPTAATARPGDELALVGLRKERGEETWSLPPWGRMRVESGMRRAS